MFIFFIKIIIEPTLLKSFNESEIRKQAGLPLLLKCNAEYDPNLNIKYEWFFNDKLLNVQKQLNEIIINYDDNDFEHYIINKDNSLIINNPTQHDIGLICFLNFFKLINFKVITFVKLLQS